MSEYRWLDLVQHPDSQVSAIDRVCVGYVLRSAVWKLSFEVFGRIEELSLPPVHSLKLGQDLWHDSCFEMFVANSNHSYREFNFSPDGRYAAADFAGYRRACRWLHEQVVASTESWRDEQRYRLDVELTESARPAMAKHVGLCSIICDKEGGKSWWALQHGKGEPDFHSVSSFHIPLA